jgi:serine protease AprX
VRESVNNTLWGGKDGRVRARTLVGVAVVAALALVAPSLAKAGAIPPELLAKAQANPTQQFNVIVQTPGGGGGSAPAAAAVAALTNDQRKVFNDAFRKAQDLQRSAVDLANKASDAAAAASTAQQRADAAAAKAAETGRDGDQNAAARAQADAAQAATDAQAAQDAATAAQAAAVAAQMGLVQQQASLMVAMGQAQGDVRWQYSVIPAVAATVTGSDIVQMQSSTDVTAVTPDTPVAPTATDNSQKWVEATYSKNFWTGQARKAAAGLTPTIAIVDSGIDASRVQDFGGRVLGQVNLTSLQPNSPGDGRGHGTMVASIAAGAAPRHAGVDPDAPLLSLDVINDNGEGLTSDVIAAADWILQNKSTYNIRVANFSLEASTDGSFQFDPLARAVEQLWFNGVVVVASAGNYATNGQQSGVHYMPAADPFVITVGALDIGRDGNVRNDVAAPWSAWGYTNDGFLKPELSAPGRYVVAACSSNGTLCRSGGQNPALASQGYAQLSGTSFAAPMVSAAAAALLGLHPEWTPDQVKGRLMLTASPLPNAVPGSVGVGELDVKDATDRINSTPPNPNYALSTFVVQSANGPVFDAASWSSAAQVNASWSSASWSSASWSSASWSSASWSSASWSSASWSSASWSSASWSSSAGALALVNNASVDASGEG